MPLVTPASLKDLTPGWKGTGRKLGILLLVYGSYWACAGHAFIQTLYCLYSLLSTYYVPTTVLGTWAAELGKMPDPNTLPSREPRSP